MKKDKSCKEIEKRIFNVETELTDEEERVRFCDKLCHETVDCINFMLEPIGDSGEFHDCILLKEGCTWEDEPNTNGYVKSGY